MVSKDSPVSERAARVTLVRTGCRAGGQGAGVAPRQRSGRCGSDLRGTEQEVAEGMKNQSEGKATRPGAQDNENLLTDGCGCYPSQSTCPSGADRWPGPQTATPITT